MKRDIEAVFLSTLARYSGAKVLVALSGGADSVALLMLCAKARDAGLISLAAAHFEHGIRYAEALRDAAFCEALSNRLGVPFYIAHADVPGEALASGEGVETCARRLRYEFLEAVSREIGANYIALAHHMDDQAETVLMHLLRGAGPEGITGMREAAGDLLRPLLGFRKHELVSYLESIGEAHMEDSTNAHADTPRNALRLNVLPAMEEVYPGACAAIARYAEIAALESGYMDALTIKWRDANVIKLPHGWAIDVADKPDEPILRRAMRKLAGRDLDNAKLNELIALLGVERGATDIFSGLRAVKTPRMVYIIGEAPIPTPAPLNIDGDTRLEGICTLQVVERTGFAEGLTQTLRLSALSGAVLRTRREGDYIQPFGMNGTKSLSDYLTDKKVDVPVRDILPILAVGSEAMWVMGTGISQHAALTGNEPALTIKCHADYDILYFTRVMGVRC